MKKILTIAVILFLCINCASTKKEVTRADQEKFESLINNKSFKIESNWANPRVTGALMSLQNAGFFPPGSTAGNIDISGNANYLIMQNDSVKAFFPYFGERRFGGYTSGNKIGIEFEGIPENYTVSTTKKGASKIQFTINDKNSRQENYDVFVHVYPNLRSSILVNSSHRTSIEYTGRLDNLDTEGK